MAGKVGLVVDDDPDALSSIRDAFANANISVVASQDKASADVITDAAITMNRADQGNLFDFAVLDASLSSTRGSNDLSGVDIAASLPKGMLKAIYTAHHEQVINRLKQKPIPNSFVMSKDYSADELVLKVQSKLEEGSTAAGGPTISSENETSPAIYDETLNRQSLVTPLRADKFATPLAESTSKSPRDSTEGVTVPHEVNDPNYAAAPLRHAPLAALVLLLLALIVGIIATVYSDIQLLIGTAVLATVAVIIIGLALIAVPMERPE